MQENTAVKETIGTKVITAEMMAQIYERYPTLKLIDDVRMARGEVLPSLPMVVPPSAKAI